jgi:hypothetical protein
MSDDRTPSQGDDSHDDDLHVKAEQVRTGTTIILEGEFDLTGIDRFWGFSAKRSRRARDRSPSTHPT